MTILTREGYLAELVALLARIEAEQGIVDHVLLGRIDYLKGTHYEDADFKNDFDTHWWQQGWDQEYRSDRDRIARLRRSGIIEANDRRAQE